jgi:hypothetical protein
MRRISIALVALSIACLVPPAHAAKLAISRIYIEYNSSGNDLGFHVFLDGENWKSLKIVSPTGITVFEVAGKAGYAQLGLTELFFEGAEPNLDDFPLGRLLALFPEGKYKFNGVTVGGAPLTGTGVLSHDVPAGPEVAADVFDGEVVIRWEPVTGPPEGFPNDDIEIVGYQVIVGSFQVTMPASATAVELPEEFVLSLGRGEHAFEVLAIESSGNQSITEGTFELD